MQVPTVNHLRTSGDYDPSANCPSLTAQPAASKPIWLIGARSPPTGTIFHNRPPDPVPGLSPPGAWHKVLPHLQLLMPAKRKLRYGMVGGGQNAFIGAVHRLAASLDGQTELVAGAFSSDAENSRTTGEQLFLNPKRVYASYAEMAGAEAALPADERIDFVAIVTPNFLHAPVATTFLKAGFHAFATSR